MADIQTVNRRGTGMPDSDVAELVAQWNALITALLSGGGVATHLPVVAEGTTSKKEVKITTATTILVNGLNVEVAAQEVPFTATTDDVADTKSAKLLLLVDAQGDVAIAKGADAASVGAAADPDILAGTVVLARVTISASGAIFDATTNDLDAGHLTVVYEDLVDVVNSISLVPG